MKKLVLINDHPENKISHYLLAIFLITLPFDRFYTQLILATFIVHTLININRQKIKGALTIQNLILSSVWLVGAIGLIYSPDKNQGAEDLLRQLPILLFPFFLSATYRRNLMMIFSLTVTIVISYLFADALFSIIKFKLSFSALFSIAFINHNFSRPIGLHATYLSMYVGLALVFFMYCLLMKRRLVYIIAMMILAAGLFQLASRSVLIATMFIFLIVFPLFLPKGNIRLRFVMVALLVSLLTLGGIFTITSFKKRYVTELKSDLTNTSVNNDALEPRVNRWGFVMELIKQKPILGYGSGTERRLLKDIYFEKKYYNSYLNGLNAHNQYLSTWLKTGVWGLLILLFTLVYGLLQSWKKKDILFAAFMIFICVVSFSENIFDVNKGIFFYAFFFSFFIKTKVNE